MIKLNDSAIEYMEMLGFTDIVLLADVCCIWIPPESAETEQRGVETVTL